MSGRNKKVFRKNWAATSKGRVVRQSRDGWSDSLETGGQTVSTRGMGDLDTRDVWSDSLKMIGGYGRPRDVSKENRGRIPPHREGEGRALRRREGEGEGRWTRKSGSPAGLRCLAERKIGGPNHLRTAYEMARRIFSVLPLGLEKLKRSARSKHRVLSAP